MSRIIIESAQGLAVSLTITALIAVFVIGALSLMFRIMDKITKANSKNNQQVVDLALRVDKNGNVLPQRVIKPTTVKEEK